MTSSAQQFIESWLFDPTIGTLVSTIATILIVMALVRISRKLLDRYVQELGNLYRAKKMVTFLGYFTALIIISLIFSDRLGKMAVAFGVAGAGIAFALQEVIASLAGWWPSRSATSTTPATVSNWAGSREMSSTSACCGRP